MSSKIGGLAKGKDGERGSSVKGKTKEQVEVKEVKDLKSEKKEQDKKQKLEKE